MAIKYNFIDFYNLSNYSYEVKAINIKYIYKLCIYVKSRQLFPY